MIGVDTNVIVRYVTQDEPDQAAEATAVFERFSEDRPGFVSMVVLVEVTWVLRRSYGLERETSAAVVRGLLAAREVVVESPDLVARALRRVRSGAEFSDAVVVEQAMAVGCSEVLTFDRRAARDAGMTLFG